MSLLDVQQLSTLFKTQRGDIYAVDDVSFHLDAGESLGLVGESGCGKSMLGLSLLRLIQPPGKLFARSIQFDGDELTQLDEAQMQRRRGAKLSMIFQEPMTSLNPVFSIGNQIVETLRLHRPLTATQAQQHAIDALLRVGIAEAKRRMHAYPHELSGGMRQRVMIAMALACQPKLLIADEPTTALDVTIQAQILNLLQSLQTQMQMSVLLISHNLGVIATLCQRVMIMYAGRIVEMAPTSVLYQNPLHPYTQGLYAALPRVAKARGAKQLHSIAGSVPDLGQLPSGCKFRNRCPLAKADCADSEPPLRQHQTGHWVRCFYA